MKTPHFFIVINLGLRSIRIVIFNSDGENIHHGWYPVESHINTVYVEQNAEEWWLLTIKLLEECITEIPSLANSKLFLTVTCSSSCLIAVDKQGEVLDNCIMVSDKRAEKQAHYIRDRYPKTNDKTRGFLAVASYMIPKILWMRENKRHIHTKTWKYMSPNDFLTYKLTGVCTTDELNAQKFYKDNVNNDVFTEICEKEHLKKSIFPDISAIGADIGPLRPELRKKLGIKGRTKVILSTYDAICAFWGAGVNEYGDCCNVIGTVSSIRVIHDKQLDFESTILSQRFDLFNSYIVGGSNNLDGGLFEWAKSAFYGDSYPDKYIHQIMEDEANQSTIGARGLIFLPYILGERAPFWDPTIRGVFLGIEKFHTRSDFMRSIFESSAYMTNDFYTELKSKNVTINNIRLSGGGSQSDLVCTLRANVTGVPIYTMHEKESTALGACIIMMKSIGTIRTRSDIKKVTTIDKIFEPDRKKNLLYQQLFAKFKILYKQLKPISDQHLSEYGSIIGSSELYKIDNL